MKSLPDELTYSEAIVPGTEHLASAAGNRGVHVVSSPSTILFIETACHHAVEKYLEENEATVGVFFSLEHCGAAVAGKPLDVSVNLIEANDKVVKLDAEVIQGSKTIMRGQHSRAIVDRNRLLKREQQPPSPQWDFWLDPVDPWSVLTARRLSRLADNYEANINWRIVKRSDVIETESPTEQWWDWHRSDLSMYAELEGVTLNPDPLEPGVGEQARKICLHIVSSDLASSAIPELLDSLWSQSRPANLDDWRETMLALKDESVIKAQLQENAAAAIEAQVPVLPCVTVGPVIYCGYHRLDLLEHHTLSAMG